MPRIFQYREFILLQEERYYFWFNDSGKKAKKNNNSKNFAFHFENDLAPYSPTSEGQPSPGMTSSGPAGVGDCPLYPPMGSGPPHLLGQPVGPSYGSIYGPQGALLQPKTILD